MIKVYVDCDVVLDLLTQRDPFYLYAAEFFKHVENKKVKAFASPLIFTNVHYILRKSFSAKETKNKLLKLRLLLSLVSIDSHILDLALSSGFKDFEDAVNYYAAIENNIPFFVTRNKKDYKKSQIPVYTAQEFINLISIL